MFLIYYIDMFRTVLKFFCIGLMVTRFSEINLNKLVCIFFVFFYYFSFGIFLFCAATPDNCVCLVYNGG